MKQQKILVVGSANTDMVIQTDHLPVLGETILGGTFFMNPSPLSMSRVAVWKSS